MYRRVSLDGLCCFLLWAALIFLSAFFATPHQLLAQAATPPGSTNVTTHIPTDQIIVKYRTSAHVGALDFIQSAPRLHMLNLVAGVAANHLRAMTDDTHVFQLTSRQSVTDVQAIADRMRQLPEVEFAEPDRILQPLVVIPNDPLWASQWQYWDTYGMNLPNAWDITTGASSTVVAVIDTGYRPHGDLAGRIIQGYDFIGNVNIANDGDGRDPDARDPGDWITQADINGAFAGWGCSVHDSSWHGTHVAGTIGANSNNGVGVSGINWFARILPVRVLGKCGGYTSDIIDGMRWAAGLPVVGVPNNANPARVMNLSLGGVGACGAAQQTAINEINSVGAIIVVAAGNSFSDTQYFNPASCNGVIAVGATNQSGVRANYSNYGALVAVSAPGGEQIFTNDPGGILSTLNAGTTVPGADNYVYYQGTSMATPHVVGLVSLMLTLSPTLNFTRTEAIIKATARPFRPGSDCPTLLCGTGIIDAFAALSATLPMAASNNAPTILGHTTNLTATINGSGLVYTWNYGDGVNGTGATVSHIYPLSGTYTAVVTATNGSYTRTALTLVTITNQAPVANAGTNQTATGYSLVTLNGSASTDPDGHVPLTYGWRQTGGTTVVLNSASISQPSFIAPPAPAVLTFTLTVTDARGLASAASARTVVTVADTPITSMMTINDSPTTLGHATTLTATANGSNVTYTWRLGDGATGTGATVSHIYPLSGTYTAVVTATNSAGRITSTAFVTITNQAPVAVVNSNQNATVNTQVTLDGSASTDPDGHLPLTYGWRQTGGMAVVLNSPVISRPIFTAPAFPDVLIFTLVVTDARGLITAAPAQTVVTVTNAPDIVVTATNSSPTTLGNITYLTATSTISGAAYIWSFGDGAGTTSPGAATNYTYLFSGTYTALVTATNGVFTQSTSTVVVIANQPPVPVISPDQSALVSTTVILDGSGSYDPDGHAPLTYGWTQSGGAAVMLNSAVISQPTFMAPDTSGVLTFTLTVTDARGLVNTMSARTTITVYDTPIANIVAINDSPTSQGQTTILTATANGSTVVYKWDFGDSIAGAGATVSHVYPLSGTYRTVVTATNSTGSITTTTFVTITPPVYTCAPLSNITVTGAPIGIVGSLQQFSVMVSPISATVPLTYTWQADGQQTVITQTTLYTSLISYSWPVTGQHSIMVTVSDACSTLNATTLIAIHSAYISYMPLILR